MAARRPPVLLGRAGERQLLDRLLENVRGGQSAVLVVRGEAGVGKTALLHYCARQASGFRVARIAGVESEMELPFAALHQLCAPMLGRLERASRATAGRPARGPGPVVRRSLPTASSSPGRAQPAGRGRRRAAAAVLRRRRAVARRRLRARCSDSSRRRLLAESVALVLAVREPSEERELAGLPELPLDGLAEEDARALLATVIVGPPRRARARPYRRRDARQSAGAPGARPGADRDAAPGRVRAGRPAAAVGAHRGELPAAPRGRSPSRRGCCCSSPRRSRSVTRCCSGVRPSGSASALRGGRRRDGRAAGDRRARGVPSPARPLGGLPVGVAAGAPGRAPGPGRGDRSARRPGPSCVAPRPGVDRSGRGGRPRTGALRAARAQARGGLGAAAAFLERAATLSPDAAAPRRAAAGGGRGQARRRCARRRAAAARRGRRRARSTSSGAPASTSCADRSPSTSSALGEAAQLLAGAARRLEPVAAGLARKTYLEALGAAMWDGERDGPAGRGPSRRPRCTRRRRPARPPRATRCSRRPRGSRPRDTGAPRPHSAGRSTLVLAPEPATDDHGHWLWFAVAGNAVTIAQELWDAGAWHALAARHEQFARDTGALVQLQFALNMVAWVHVVGRRPASIAASCSTRSSWSRRRPGTRRSPTPRWSSRPGAVRTGRRPS